jgi:signal transduction histidine kinase
MQSSMEKNQVIFAVLLGTAVLLLLAGFLLFFLIRYRTKKNQYIHEKENLQKEFEQTLLQSQVEVQENTFSDLSAELHDNIGQLLVSTKALIGVTQRKLPMVSETLQIADETLAKAINEIRSLSKLLDKDWLQQFDFIDNLRTEVKRISAMKTLEINFNHPEKILLPSEEQIILFRIVQEALQNSVKHSNAGKIDIDIAHSMSSLVVNINDDGNGFKKDAMMHTSLGLKNMKHRTQLLGGTIDWISSPGNGSSVILKLPVKKSEL